MPTIADIQRLLALPADGTWSPTDQQALLKASGTVKKRVQSLLSVTPDGIWMTKSQGALNELRALAGDDWIYCQASSFADPKDVAAFKRCKQGGKTDLQCFAVGDNGVGQFGVITAQDVTPYVAVHHDDMVSRWGSEHGAALREVELIIAGHPEPIIAKVGDRISERGRIDCNPAILKIAGRKAPMMTGAQWRWR